MLPLGWSPRPPSDSAELDKTRRDWVLSSIPSRSPSFFVCYFEPRQQFEVNNRFRFLNHHFGYIYLITATVGILFHRLFYQSTSLFIANYGLRLNPLGVRTLTRNLWSVFRCQLGIGGCPSVSTLDITGLTQEPHLTPDSLSVLILLNDGTLFSLPS